MTVDKLKMHSPDLTQRNIDAIAELFPTVVTETVDADGNPVRAVDFDALRQELSDHVVEGPQERYQLDWPGKRAAAFAANAPIAKTLRPVREESVDFDTTKNLFIEGDNLDALKLLQESYLGKVKLIYIDPPYNTGNDFVYEDDFAESSADYLAALRPEVGDGRPPRREHRGQRPLPLRLAEHDVLATEAGARPVDRRRSHHRRDRRPRARESALAPRPCLRSGQLPCERRVAGRRQERRSIAHSWRSGLHADLCARRDKTLLVANDVRWSEPKRGYDLVMDAAAAAMGQVGTRSCTSNESLSGVVAVQARN